MRFFIVLLFVFNLSMAQKTCIYGTNEIDSLGVLKITKEILMYEKIFGASEKYIYFSLGNDNGLPFLSLSIVEKNNEFIPTICFDTKSKIFIQLSNNKIIPLLCNENDICSKNLPGIADNRFARITQANFLFPKNVWDDLKNESIQFIRIASSTSSQDIVVKETIESSLTKDFFRPSQIFMDYLHCIE
jgi:hypothetical protein